MIDDDEESEKNLFYFRVACDTCKAKEAKEREDMEKKKCQESDERFLTFMESRSDLFKSAEWQCYDCKAFQKIWIPKDFPLNLSDPTDIICEPCERKRILETRQQIIKEQQETLADIQKTAQKEKQEESFEEITYQVSYHARFGGVYYSTHFDAFDCARGPNLQKEDMEETRKIKLCKEALQKLADSYVANHRAIPDPSENKVIEFYSTDPNCELLYIPVTIRVPKHRVTFKRQLPEILVGKTRQSLIHRFLSFVATLEESVQNLQREREKLVRVIREKKKLSESAVLAHSDDQWSYLIDPFEYKEKDETTLLATLNQLQAEVDGFCKPSSVPTATNHRFAFYMQSIPDRGDLSDTTSNFGQYKPKIDYSPKSLADRNLLMEKFNCQEDPIGQQTVASLQKLYVEVSRKRKQEESGRNSNIVVDDSSDSDEFY